MADSKKSREQRGNAEEAKKGRKISAPMAVEGSAPKSKSSHSSSSSSGHSEGEEGGSSSEHPASKKRTHSSSSDEEGSESAGEKQSESAGEEQSKSASPATKKMDFGRKGAESQRTTKKNDEVASLKQHKGFTNKWSDEDELKVLQSLVDMCDENGADHSVTNPDWNLIYAYMSKISDWDFKFEKRQLCDKVRRFRIAYEKLGDAPAFSNVHKKKCYELSKKIWGKRDDDIIDTMDGVREVISNVEDFKANFPLLAEEVGQVLNADVTDFSSETWFRFISLKEANKVEKEIRDFKLLVASKDLSLKRMAFSLVNGARTRARRASS